MSSSNEPEHGTVFPTEIKGPERRRNLRFPFAVSAVVTEIKSGARIAGRTIDLGLGGCFVAAVSTFPVGTDALVHIQKGDEYFEAKVKVVNSQIGAGMGLVFVSAQPKHYRLFQRWLLEINSTSPLPLDVPIEVALHVPPDVPEQTHEEFIAGTVSEETGSVLNELLTALVRKHVLTEDEGMAMLKKLPR